MHPAIAHLQAFLASLGLGPDVLDLFQVLAGTCHAYAPFSRGAIGTRTAKRVSPGTDEKETEPFSLRTIRRTVSNPRPVPFPTGFVVKNCSKIWDCTSFGMPGPLSPISTRTQSLSGAVRMERIPLFCIASEALSLGLVQICLR